MFYLHDKTVIKDDGNRFHVAANANHDVLTTALIYAKQRHGYQLSVNGNELFQENVVRASVKAGLNISFDQDHLERRRVQLSAENATCSAMGALRNSTQQHRPGHEAMSMRRSENHVSIAACLPNAFFLGLWRMAVFKVYPRFSGYFFNGLADPYLIWLLPET